MWVSPAPSPWTALPGEKGLGEQQPQGGQDIGGGREEAGVCGILSPRLLRPLPHPRGPLTPPTPFSSGLHVLTLHLNTHSPTICLGLSEDQWGSQGPAQQEAAG